MVVPVDVSNNVKHHLQFNFGSLKISTMIEILRDHLRSPVAILDAEGRVDFWSDALGRILGTPESEALGRKFDQVVEVHTRRECWSSLPGWKRPSMEEFKMGVPVVLPVSPCPSLIVAKEVETNRFVVDIRIAEESLRSGKRRVLGWFDLETGLACFSDLFLTTLSYRDHSFPPVQESWLTLVHPEDSGRASDLLSTLSEIRSSSVSCSLRMRAGDGTYRLIHHRFYPIHFTGGVPRIVCISQTSDLVEDVRVHLSSDTLTEMLQAVHEGIAVCQVDGSVIRLNDVATAWSGVEISLITGRPVETLLPIENEHDGLPFVGYVERCVRDKRKYSFPRNRVLRLPSGGVIPVEITVIPLGGASITGVMVVLRDMEERHSRDREQQNAQKAQTLIAGLQSLSADLTDSILRLESSHLAAIEPLLRVKRLCLQLSKFVGNDPGFSDLVTVDDAIVEATEMAIRGTVIRARYDLNTPIPVSTCDPQQLSQIVFNIVANARDAMTDGGMVTIESRVLDRNNFVLLRIVDEGFGISAEHINHVIEPYYTTKNGAGGLGLSVVSSVITGVGGYLEIDSEPGFGTSVTIYLPVVPLEPGMRAPLNITVLIWHQNRRELHRLARILVSLGCRVGAVSDRVQFIRERERLLQREKGIDLVILGLSSCGQMESIIREWRNGNDQTRVIVSMDGGTDSSGETERIGAAGVLRGSAMYTDILRMIREIFPGPE